MVDVATRVSRRTGKASQWALPHTDGTLPGSALALVSVRAFARSPAEADMGPMSYHAARGAAAGEYGASHSACNEADAMRRTGPHILWTGYWSTAGNWRLPVRRRRSIRRGHAPFAHSTSPRLSVGETGTRHGRRRLDARLSVVNVSREPRAVDCTPSSRGLTSTLARTPSWPFGSSGNRLTTY